MIASRRVWEQAALESGCRVVDLERAARLAQECEALDVARVLDQLCAVLREPDFTTAEVALTRFARVAHGTLNGKSGRTVEALLTTARRIAHDDVGRREVVA